MRLVILALFLSVFAGVWVLQGSRRSELVLRTLAKTCLLLLPVAALALILRYGADLPYLDSWGDIFMYQAPLRLAAIRTSTGGHIVIFPRLAEYIIGNLTAWNTTWFLVQQWAFLLLSALMIALFLRNIRPSQSKTDPLPTLALFAMALALSPTNAYYDFDNRLIGHVMAPFLFFAALLLLWKGPYWTRNTLAPLVCVVATFSTSFGLLTWPALLPKVVFDERRSVWGTCCWLVCLLISLFLFKRWFVLGYGAGAGAGAFLTLKAIGLGLVDFVVLLGVFIYPYPFVMEHFLWLLAPGSFLIACQAFISWKHIRKIGPRLWITHPAAVTLIYSTLAGLMATVARAKFYPFDSLGMRYNQMAFVFIAALVAQIMCVGAPKRLEKALISLCLASFAIGMGYLWHRARSWDRTVSEVRQCLFSPEPFRDFGCYQKVFTDLNAPERRKEFVRDIAFMKANRISVFRRTGE